MTVSWRLPTAPPAPGPAMLAFLEAVPMALALLDPGSLELRAGNAELAALLACPAEHLAETWRAALAHPTDGPYLSIPLLAGGLEPFEACLCLHSNVCRDILVRSRPARLEGQDWLVVTLQDITRRKRAEAAQAAAESESERRLAELETLYRTAPMGLAQLDSNLRFVRVNEALASMNGMSLEDHVGRSVWSIVPGMQQELEPLLRRVLETGEVACGVKLSGQTPAAPGMLRHWLARYYPLRDPATQDVAGIGIVVEETTRRQRAEQAQALLLRELDHRVKNLFAVIAGLVTFTARSAQDPQEMRATLLGRIDALARAHDLVKLAIGGSLAAAEGAPHHTTVRALVEALLAPFRTARDPQRLLLAEEEVGVGALAAPPLALLLHELATNAARHGSLARPDGRLEVRWQPDRAEGMLRLAWDEHNASAVRPDSSQGFGHRLVTQSALQLGGHASFNWRPEGLLVEVVLPLARLEN